MSGDQAALKFGMDQSLVEEDLLKGLNPPQQQAVLHGEGPILVLAGAGSGKTRVLAHRVAHLVGVRGVYPDRILAVTFTNKAAEEMRSRLKGLLGEKADRLWMSTFHSSGLRILRHNAKLLSYSNQFVIYDDQDSKGVLKEIIKELNIDEERYPLDTFTRAIDKAKNNFQTPHEIAKQASDMATELQAQVYDKYQKALLAADAMDFGDLLMNAVRVLREFPEALEYYRRNIHYILVDEFQDTNRVQYLFIRLLAEPRRNLFVVGDDDQSIYAFRGATISNILEFERDFPQTKVVKLEQNYRSTGTILDAAHSVIEKNKARKPKKLWTSSESGEPIRTFIGHDENMEADFIASEIKKLVSAGEYNFGEIAVLYRTNAQTRALEESLVRFRVPYKIFGGLKFFDRKEIKDILGYLRLLVHPADNQAFQRVINTPPRGIGAQALQAIVDEAKRAQTPYLHASLTIAEKNKSVQKFLELMADLKRTMLSNGLGELIAYIIQASEYGPRLEVMKDPAAHSRLENLQELIAIGHATSSSTSASCEEAVKGFLDRVSLTSSADQPVQDSTSEMEGEKPPTVSLMTLHLAKGLEFPVVFLAGLEKGLLPHYRSLEDSVAMEEERRLCYVGITRAMRTLYFTRAYQRGMFASGGSAGSGGGARLVSPFVKDIPFEKMVAVGEERSQGASFIDGYPRFEIDDDDFYGSDGYSSMRRKKEVFGDNKAFKREAAAQSASSLSLDSIRKLLAPADSLDATKNTPSPEYYSKEAATLDQLAAGVRVIHPSFGIGAVEEVTGSGLTAAVSVKFDGYDEKKKLVFRFAKLALYD